jgi:hypothetical protein
MVRLVIAALAIATWCLVSPGTSAGQWHNHVHGNHGTVHLGGGHFDYHNGHIDYHQPGHFDIHNGHLDYHPGHVDHLMPQYSYPSTIYPNYVSPGIVYPPMGGTTVLPGFALPSYPTSSGVTGNTVISTSPPTVTAQRPPVVPGNTANALSPVASGPTPNSRPITIRNPEKYSTPLTFKLNEQQVRLEPGQQTTVTFDRSFNIEFDRGGQYGTQRYSMQDGNFEFIVGDRGWDLRRYTEAASTSPQLNNPLPANPLPANPLPPGGN